MHRNDLMTEFNALLPGETGAQGPSRRVALKAALGVGYAAAAMPIMAQTAIKTSSEGLTTGESTYEVNGFKVPIFHAAPAGKTNLPVVLIIHEIFGVHEYIADTCRRFAKAGYLAIAPEMFARQGDPSSYTQVAKLMAEVVSKVPDEQVMKDLDAAVAWAGENGGNLKKVGITGFCWGGRITWLYVAHNPQVRAGVAWYGRIVGQNSVLNPRHPIDVARQLHGPVLGLYGGLDQGIPLDTLDQMRKALAESGNAPSKSSTIQVYADAPHAFNADYRPSYRKEAADDGWKRLLAWFKQNGV